MQHKYKDFYDAFQMQKVQDENNLITKYKNEEKLLKTIKEKTFFYLGLIEAQLNSNDVEAAYATIKKMPIFLKFFSPEEKLVYNILRAKIYYAKKDYARTILLLKTAAYDTHGVYFNTVSVLYIQSLVNLNLKFEAIEYFQRESRLFESILNWDDYNSLLVKISSFLIDYSQYTEALEYLKRPLLYYPLYDSGYKAMQLLTKIECAGNSLGELFHVPQNNTLLEDQIFNRTAFNKDAKNFVLAMAEIDPKNLIPTKNIDAISLLEKENLLHKLKTLISARQYPLAKKMADYLSKAKIFQGDFQEDEILFYKARVYNSLNKPLFAAQSYKELIDKHPLSNLVKAAKLRYSFSLKFAEKYEKSIEFIRKNSIFSNTNEEDFFVSWLYYMNKDYQKSIETLEGIENNNSLQDYYYTKSVFWINKANKHIRHKNAPIPNLEQISPQSINYPYPVFARPFSLIKKEYLEEKLLDKLNFENKINLPLINKNSSVRKELVLISFLVQAHLNSFAVLQIQSLAKQPLTREEQLILAEYAYLCSDFSDPYKFSSHVEKLETKNLDFESLSPEKKDLYKLNYPLAYWSDVKRAADLLNLDPFWILSVMRAESSYDPNAESPVGAVGLMQIMPYTGVKILNYLTSGKDMHKIFSISMLRQPDKSIMFSAWYLKLLLENYKGNYILATAAYNAGPEAINRWIKQYPSFDTTEFFENIPFNETKKYVASIVGSMDMYSRIYLNHPEYLNFDVNINLSELSPENLF